MAGQSDLGFYTDNTWPSHNWPSCGPDWRTIMSDADSQSSWKEKYLSLLDAVDKRDKLEQQRVDLLRKALVRVSLAADGQDAALDDALADLRGALRSGDDVLQLETRVNTLDHLIVSLDTQRQDQQSSVQQLLLQGLDTALGKPLPRNLKSQLRDLRKDIPKWLADNQPRKAWEGYLAFASGLTDYIDELQAAERPAGGLLARLFSGKPAPDKKPPSLEDDPEPAERQAEGERDPAAYDANQLDDEADASTIMRVAEEEILPQLQASVADMENQGAERGQAIKERIASVLRNLLDQIDLPDHLKQRRESLVERIQSPFEWGQLPDFLHEAAELVASTRMLAQREFEGFLLTLHARLHDIQDFLEAARQGEEQSQLNQARLDEDVRSELKEMRESVASSSDVGKIKMDIESMVTRIVSVVDEFHRVEQQRRVEVYNRMEDLNKRMETMESEATTLKSSLEASRLQASKDALTGLPNRQAYDEQIEREFSRWKRHGHPLSLAVADVDFFKKINDSLGHLRGDKVLKLVAREMRRCVRSEDFVARYGGEEFAIVMPDTDKDAAMAAMDKVRSSIEECPFNFANQRVPITCSVGVATFRQTDSVEACFDRADKALYAAKQNGRNRVEGEQG